METALWSCPSMPSSGPWRFASKGMTSNRCNPFLPTISKESFQFFPKGATNPVAENAIDTIRLLVVSREPAVLRPLWSIGESNSWHLETAGSGWEALERLQSGAVPDLLLLELSGDDGDGLHVLRWLRRVRPDVPIVLICPHDDADHKREAIRIGAQAILVRPL